MTDQSTAITQTPPKRQLGPRKASDVPKQPRITPLIRAAVALMLDEDVSITEAANRLQCSRFHLGRMLNRDHVNDYWAREERRRVAGKRAGAEASRVFRGLLRAESEKVQLEVCQKILTERGSLSRDQGRNTSVNVSIAAGYIIKLRDKQDEPPTIEAKAEVVQG